MRSVHFGLVLSLALLGALASGCRNQRGSIASCTPGESLVIGCDDTVGVTCSGDPTLTICDGAIISVPENCTRGGSGFLAFSDDEGSGFCPLLTTICPSSGSIAINPDPFGRSSTTWSCTYAVIRGGVGP